MKHILTIRDVIISPEGYEFCCISCGKHLFVPAWDYYNVIVNHEGITDEPQITCCNINYYFKD